MMHSIYFTRHGRVHEGDFLSMQGREELECIQQLLAAHAFKPIVAISSPTRRCLETARLLLNGEYRQPISVVHPCEELHIFGDIPQLRPQASSLLPFIKTYAENQDVIVSSHDSMSVALAFSFLEERGVTVDWNLPRHIRFLDQGEGILVKNKTYWHLHAKAKATIR